MVKLSWQRHGDVHIGIHDGEVRGIIRETEKGFQAISVENNGKIWRKNERCFPSVRLAKENLEEFLDSSL